MLLEASEYERKKAENKLRNPSLRLASPDDRWRTTLWFGVSTLVLQRLERRHILEHKINPETGQDLWRERV